MEKWKVISECPEFEVSSEGRVRSIPRVVERKPKGRKPYSIFVKGGVLAPSLKTQGGRPVALRVTLCGSKAKCYRYVHRLVLEAFVGPAPAGTEACHADGNPLNNTVKNLRWDSHKSNYLDSVAHGTNTLPPKHSGERHHKTTLSDQQVAEIRNSAVPKGGYSALGRKYGVTHQTIRRIILGLTRV